ncbi:MAG: elongation factor G, partial [Symbiobacteriaceae bacterium]|nr:elongation factor G [Symbiobacteriaceae bacterium]
GHVDFTVEVERSLRVLDGAIAVFCAKGGVEPQSETVWRQADRYQVPRIAYVNKMDITGANFERVMEMMHTRLGANPLAMQLPIGSENDFQGIVDLVEQKAIYYLDTEGRETDVRAIPEDMQSRVAEYHHRILEKIADYSDELMVKYLDGDLITPEEIKQAVRKATLAVEIVPVFCGSSYKNKGVPLLLDGVVDYLPSPSDIGHVDGFSPNDPEVIISCLCDDEAPLAALAFKVQADQHIGKLVYVRLYSGSIQTGSYIFNPIKRRKERVGRVLRMHASRREEISEIYAGEICAIVGLKDTYTGDTLCTEGNQLVLESMNFPEPVINQAIEPKTKMDQDKLSTALQRLSEEDPSFRAYSNPETGQTLIAGMGELHLEIIVDRLQREFKVEANIGRPQVAYRETITRSVTGEGRFVRQTGGRGQYGHAVIRVDPLPTGTGYEFRHELVGGSVPREYINPVDAGIKDAMQNGVLAGFPTIDLMATLIDGSFHEVDSSELAFKIAGSMAFRDAAAKAGPILLEPIMRVEVIVPEEYLGDVIGDINSRRGHIEGMETRSSAQSVVRANVPLAAMFGYATDLRSKTQGRATYSMEPSHYAEVPKNVAQEIVVRMRGSSWGMAGNNR